MKKVLSIVGVLLLLNAFLLFAKQRPDTEFQFEIIDSDMVVFNNDTYVGKVKIQGQLDSLLVDYNQ